MNIHCLFKRYYTNKDLIIDRFGRLYHLPIQLTRQGNNVSVDAIDYRNKDSTIINSTNISFSTVPATFTQLPKLIPSLYNTIRRAKPDIVIASGDSHIGYIGLQMTRRLGVPFVFDIYDYYPAFASNRLPGMKAMFRSAAQNADLVLCASEPLQQFLRTLNPNTLLIENGVDRNLFAPGNIKQARKTTGLEEESLLIGYFGSITQTRGPLLIEACRKLRQEMPSLRLVLAGRISTTIADEPWIRYLGEKPQSSVSDLINACNLVVIPYMNDEFNSMAGACKIAEYLACEKPVVATRVSGHEQLFKDAPESLCETNPDDMARALRNQLNNPVTAPFPESMNWESIGKILYTSLLQIRQRNVLHRKS
ncbi:MAG: glycosyltransferase family 4 protein [Gammaproteobacteria bacterium]|nr:glycosyltransferase family 4 protein [Gammaproteobacteria bacterium]